MLVPLLKQETNKTLERALTQQTMFRLIVCWTCLWRRQVKLWHARRHMSVKTNAEFEETLRHAV